MATSAEKSIIKEITFQADGLELRGDLHLPAVKQPPVVIGSHGLFSSRNSPKQIALADQCNRLNIAFFRFDHRGCGDSQGKFEAVTSLEARFNDLVSAIDWITHRKDLGDRIGLFGSSMGGAACLSVASKIEITTMVTVAAPIRSKHIHSAIENSDALNHPGSRFDAKRNAFDISQGLLNIRNILIFHGDADTVVPVSHAREIFQQVGDPKKLNILNGGDHRMSSPVHQEEFLRKASLWFRSGLSVNT
jgi:alpha-beta hydrolase superfamily lysophospholipase